MTTDGLPVFSSKDYLFTCFAVKCYNVISLLYLTSFQTEVFLMNQNILVIGGSYFTGRVFVMTALQEGHRLTLINRGRYSMKDFGPVTEYHCDRHDAAALKALPLASSYDAVVDFCAYAPGDISLVVDSLPCTFSKYIYISTADVLAPSREVRTEDSPLLKTHGSDPVSTYTYHKMLLEKELADTAGKAGFSYTILRSAFIFGPYNYAPRESWYVRQIVQGSAIPHPVDADGRFQMVYVKDVARAILSCIGSTASDDQTYLLSHPEVMDYDAFLELLGALTTLPVKTYPVTVAEVLSKRIPLPFPLTTDENARFDGSKITRELGFAYEDFRESMQKTWNAFYGVFS